MIRRWLCYLALLLMAFGFYLYYYGWLSWYLLLVLLALPGLSLLLSLPAMLGQRVKWNWKADARCIREQTALLRLGGRTAWVPAPRCRLRLQLYGLGSGQKQDLDLWLTEVQQLPLNTDHCGVLHCQLTRVWVYDYLGLFRLPRKLPPARELSILPVAAPPNPLPHLENLDSQRWRPKLGGGFAEQHELREYRPGDPLRSIHWKLTAKTDEWIVREAMEPERQRILLSFDLPMEPMALDATMDQLCWLSNWLTTRNLPHELRWLEPTTGELHIARIEQQSDFDAVLDDLLRTPLQSDAPSLQGRQFPEADWHYHILPERRQQKEGETTK